MFFYPLVILIGCVLQGLFIYVEHKEKYVPAVILKGCASLLFCLIGLLGLTVTIGAVKNISYEPTFYPDYSKLVEQAELIFAGLLFGALGDVLLNLRFVFPKKGQKIFLAGIAAFLVGHILYMISLIILSSNVLICTVCGVVLAAILLIIIFKTFDVKLAFKIFGVFYIGAVCLMTAYSIGNCITFMGSEGTLLYAIGAVAFLISDVVLIFNTFGNTSRFSLRITNLSLYYIGQLLIATSLFLF